VEACSRLAAIYGIDASCFAALLAEARGARER
jgi:hypothetical protein